MGVRSIGLLALGAVALAFPAACGTDAVGVDPCRQIEEARCRQAPACGISLQPPVSTTGTDVDACIRYYDDACLHGLEVAAPGSSAVNECVQAIQTHGCAVVSVPQSDPSCAWLIPPQTSASDASDAPSDSADASDATTE
jgi:hypothetical protein